MPRGVPNSGYRKTAKRISGVEFGSFEPLQMESDDEISARITERFLCLEELTTVSYTHLTLPTTSRV